MKKISSFMRRLSMAPPFRITEEDCHRILTQRLRSSRYELLSFEILNFHNCLQGLIGEHFSLCIKYRYKNKQEAEEFFVKTLSSNPLMYDFSVSLQVYEKESFFYKLLSMFEKSNIDTSFAPKGYLFRPYIVIVEDLSRKFQGTPKCELLNLDYCKSSLEAIAKFHAASVIYEKKKEKELSKKFCLKDEYPDMLADKFASNEDNIATRWMMSSIEGILELIPRLPKSHVSEKDFKEKILEVVSTSDTKSLISGVLHGDLWSSNLLHMENFGRIVESKLIDYQLIKYGPLEQDVVEFLMTNAPRSLYEENFDYLIKHYYDFLHDTIYSVLYEDKFLPSLKDFVNSCRKFQVVGKIHAVLDHSYTFVENEIYQNVLKSELSWHRFLFEDRGKYILESFRKDQRYRDMLTEDLVTLRNLLFP